MLVQEFLIIEFLCEQFAFCRAADERALVGKHQLLHFNQLTCFCKYLCLTAALHVEEYDACIYIAGVEQILSVVVICRGIFVRAHIYAI